MPDQCVGGALERRRADAHGVRQRLRHRGWDGPRPQHQGHAPRPKFAPGV